MKDWKVHLVWASAALLSAFVWGRYIDSERHARMGARLQGLEKSQEPVLSPGAQRIPPSPLPGLELPSKSFQSMTSTSRNPILSPSPRAVDPAEIPRLLESKDKGDHWKAYMTIAQMQTGAQKLGFVKQLLGMEEEQIRCNSLHLLRGNSDEDLLPILGKSLRTDPAVAVRQIAAQLLGTLGDPRSVDLLLKAFQSDTGEVQVKAAVALVKMGHPESAVALIPSLAAGLDHPDGAIRQTTTQQLSSLVVPATIPYLARALRDSSGDVRGQAIRGLGSLGSRDVIPLLAPLVHDPVKWVADTARETIDSLVPDEGN